jgi:hypothetical protein
MSWKKCSGSGTVQMLAWDPSDEPAPELDGKPYPGACICLGCSHGVLVKIGSVHEAVAVSGLAGLAGTMRTHYVHSSDGTLKYRGLT